MHTTAPVVARVDPSDSRVARYLRAKMEELVGVKNQREIAREIGYERANVISMFKSGQLRVPLDKVPALAKALNVDPALLFRMVLAEYWPGWQDAVTEIFGTVVTRNEAEILTRIRELTNESDPSVTQLGEKLSAVFDGRGPCANG